MKKAFTLAEVMITITLIGIVAAITIPSVVVNTQEHEFKAGLRKAVTALNQAIAANIAIEGENAARNKNLFNYLQRHMNVVEAVDDLTEKYGTPYKNAAFYTADGFRYEFSKTGNAMQNMSTYESRANNSKINGGDPFFPCSGGYKCGGCGSGGLVEDPQYRKAPCIIVVDVNGDNKPNPANADCKGNYGCNVTQTLASPSPGGKKLTDLFTIMITENKAVPYGTYAQRMMYQK